MIEDRLTPNERIRLESIAQSIAFNVHKPGAEAETVLVDAKKFQNFITDGVIPVRPSPLRG